ncbi:hypothetical protein D4764_06G0002490 [Takifugu flavidus]|uniref:Uncharacterized protein n=1 Tax=Takifugu flavidus TaxID=433684 RepID=A0A5C6MVC2_9TELE|nr:hypothetical protein D4764_06G0002490 [Takifugu flavidus]
MALNEPPELRVRREEEGAQEVAGIPGEGRGGEGRGGEERRGEERRGEERRGEERRERRGERGEERRAGRPELFMSEIGEGKEKCSPGNGVQYWACGSGSRSLDEKSGSAAEVNKGDRGALFPSRCSAALAPQLSSGSDLTISPSRKGARSEIPVKLSEQTEIESLDYLVGPFARPVATYSGAANVKQERHNRGRRRVRARGGRSRSEEGRDEWSAASRVTATPPS